jgi:hypothetical protein
LDEDLAARIPSLHVVVQNAPPDADPHLTIDGVAIPAAAVSAPIKLDPGHHVVAARDARAEVDVAERETKSVTLTLRAIAATTLQPSPGEPLPPPAGEPPRTMRTLAIAGFAVGGAALAAGAITGLMSIQKTSTVKAACNGNECPTSSASDLDSARSAATISTIAFVTGGVGLAVGVSALLIGDKPSTEPTTTAKVTPWIGPGSAGLSGTF